MQNNYIYGSICCISFVLIIVIFFIMVLQWFDKDNECYIMIIPIRLIKKQLKYCKNSKNLM